MYEFQSTYHNLDQKKHKQQHWSRLFCRDLRLGINQYTSKVDRYKWKEVPLTQSSNPTSRLSVWSMIMRVPGVICGRWLVSSVRNVRTKPIPSIPLWSCQLNPFIVYFGFRISFAAAWSDNCSLEAFLISFTSSGEETKVIQLSGECMRIAFPFICNWFFSALFRYSVKFDMPYLRICCHDSPMCCYGVCEKLPLSLAKALDGSKQWDVHYVDFLWLKLARKRETEVQINVSVTGRQTLSNTSVATKISQAQRRSEANIVTATKWSRHNTHCGM